MNPLYINYKVGDLVVNPLSGVVGVVTTRNYWVQDEYLSTEEEVVDVMFGEIISKQYPVRYIEKLN